MILAIVTSAYRAEFACAHSPTAASRGVEYMWNRLDIMETIQVVLDKKLLRATDQAARQTKRNRSALVRDALREHLRALDTRAREERDRRGYAARLQVADETDVWEAEAVW